MISIEGFHRLGMLVGALPATGAARAVTRVPSHAVALGA